MKVAVYLLTKSLWKTRSFHHNRTITKGEWGTERNVTARCWRAT